MPKKTASKGFVRTTIPCKGFVRTKQKKYIVRTDFFTFGDSPKPLDNFDIYQNIVIY